MNAGCCGETEKKRHLLACSECIIRSEQLLLLGLCILITRGIIHTIVHAAWMTMMGLLRVFVMNGEMYVVVHVLYYYYFGTLFVRRQTKTEGV